MEVRAGGKLRIADAIRHRYRVGAPAAMQLVLDHWFDTPAGRAVLEAERAACLRLPGAPGFRLVHLGIAPGKGVAIGFPQACRFSLAAAPGEEVAAVVAFDALPLPSDTVDVVVLHHVLDFARLPHAVLAEAARTLRPGGRLVLVGFDPYSPFGIAKWLISPLCARSVWRHNSLRRSRLVDWLALLGFAIDTPVREAKNAWRMPFENVWRMLFDSRGVRSYVITATKRTVPLQPLYQRPRMRGAALLGAGAGRARVAANSGER